MASGTDSGLDTWLSPSCRSLVLGTLLPTSVILLTMLYDVIAWIRWPRGFCYMWRVLVSPFRDFLSVDDLEGGHGPITIQPLWKIRSLVVLSATQLIFWATVLSCDILAGDVQWAQLSLACTGFLAWLYALARIIIKPPFTPPYLLLLFYGANAVSGSAELIATTLESDLELSPIILNFFRATVPTALLWIAGTYPLNKVLPCANVAGGNDKPSSALTMPEDSVGLWSWMTISFVEPIFDVAKKRTIHETDVWSLSPFFAHKNLFTKYLAYRERHPSHSLLRFLLASNSLDLVLDASLEIWGAVFSFVPPYALQQILTSLADPKSEGRTRAYMYAFLFFSANIFLAQINVFQTWYTRRCYERTRGQLFCVLHWKALKRQEVSEKVASPNQHSDGSDISADGADLGKIVNLMQGDSQAVAQRFWEFSGSFSSSIRLVTALVYLYNILGWSAFAGVAVVMIAYILNSPLAKYNVYITRRSWAARDRRMSRVNELFQNIRFLKFYAWESRWTARVRDFREEELRWHVRENMVNVAISFIWNWLPYSTALSTFLCYTLIAGEKLTVAKAFTSMALFSSLQGPMASLPDQIVALLDAYVSIQRIEEFLRENEVPDWASTLKSQDSSPLNTVDSRVGFEKATFTWDAAPRDELSMFTLGPLDITFPQGSLSLVKGPTGSGKTALLKGLLGELVCSSGQVLFNKAGHRVAYCAQSPWLEHITIRDNIIFGSVAGYNEGRYQAVIEACALRHDLDNLDSGDLTEIGEKGTAMSGGQRARIALARALYSQASVIILDDPLAHVDMHTAHHLVNHALSGPIVAGRTIILVTHHINLCLPVSVYLVELANGKVLHKGRVQELQKRGLFPSVIASEEMLESPTNNVIEEESTEVSTTKCSCSHGKLLEDEARAEGRVSLHSYVTYIRAAGFLCWTVTVWLLVQLRLINIAAQLFLVKWGEAYNESNVFDTSAIEGWFRFWQHFPAPNQNAMPWLLAYFYLSISGAVSLLAFAFIGYYGSLQASRALFTRMLARLTAAPTRFFDTTPIGRILNRWTSDMNTVDTQLQNSIRAAMVGTLSFLASFIVIIYAIPSFAPLALFIAWLYIRLAPPYIQASRDLRRLESVSLSPALVGFDELLRGLVHIRAFAMEWRYHDGFYRKLDRFQSYDHTYWLVANWIHWRYDCLGSIVVLLTTIFAIWSGFSDGLAALVIVQSETFSGASRQLVKVLAQLELDFNSIERISEYLDVPQEAPSIIPAMRPPAIWPTSDGGLSVQDLEVRYAPELPLVLKKVSFTIRPKEKIGVVGRTGSGKSSLALSILRIIEPSGGSILLDGIDITSIGLDDLRTRVTIVSQDVSLFTGTIRSNIDPFFEHSEKECLDVLERWHLEIVSDTADRKSSGHAFSLNTPISQTGSLSAGERQLLALARAALRRSNVVILDEATSHVDTVLDDQIQRTIREELAESIVITIAHRLHTVIDYDRIMVLGNGEILEFDTPQTLLQKSGGVFKDMCRASADWPFLQAIALGRDR